MWRGKLTCSILAGHEEAELLKIGAVGLDGPDQTVLEVPQFLPHTVFKHYIYSTGMYKDN